MTYQRVSKGIFRTFSQMLFLLFMAMTSLAEARPRWITLFYPGEQFSMIKINKFNSGFRKMSIKFKEQAGQVLGRFLRIRLKNPGRSLWESKARFFLNPAKHSPRILKRLLLLSRNGPSRKSANDCTKSLIIILLRYPPEFCPEYSLNSIKDSSKILPRILWESTSGISQNPTQDASWILHKNLLWSLSESCEENAQNTGLYCARMLPRFSYASAQVHISQIPTQNVPTI